MAGRKIMQCAGPSYHLEDKKAAVQSAVNCYMQQTGTDSPMMQGVPGEVLLCGLSEEGRASREVNGRWFVVAGDRLYEMFTDGAFTLRGTLSTSTGIVGMASNRTQMAIVDGPYLYVFTLATNTFTQIVSDGWRGSASVHELDGYFIFVDPETDQFYLSAIDDGTMLDALDFSSADSAPDDIVSHIVSHRQAWFLGDLSSEIWVNSGDASFPFVRYQSYTLDVGVVGKHAAIAAADTIFWLGKTRRGVGIVYMASGNQPQRVSTLAVEEALRASSDLSAATMWTYQIEGHEFVGINAPGLDTTWGYDAAMQQWHERAEWDNGWHPLRSRFYTSFKGQQYGLDEFGAVTRLDPTVNSLCGRPLVRERTWPHFMKDDMEPTSFRELQLAMTTGHGGNVTLEVSNDGGKTFNAPLLRSLGSVGRWMQKVRWLGLGTAINRVFRIRVSDDVPFAIHQAAVDA